MTIALYELEPFRASDVAAYQRCMGTSVPVSLVAVDRGAGAGAGSGEATMDVQTLIGLAPQASVRVYEGPPTGLGAYDTDSRIVSEDAAQVISTSWGLCEALQGAAAAGAESTLLQEATVQGQSFIAASGDLGADDCDAGQRAVDDPASQPWATAVGGSSIHGALDTVWTTGTAPAAEGPRSCGRRPPTRSASPSPGRG